MKKWVDINVVYTLSFDDNGVDSLEDQAHESLLKQFGIHANSDGVMEINIVGGPRDTELPEQK